MKAAITNAQTLMTPTRAVDALGRHWPEYLMEAFGLGLFMLLACGVGVVLQHPSSPVRRMFPDATPRRLLFGLAMGVVAILNIYSPWGKRSGSHLNPATTLTFWRLGKVETWDAVFYSLAQFVGGIAGVLIARIVFGSLIAHPEVNYVATTPGPSGELVAFAAEALMAFGLISVVLRVSNVEQLARYTGLFVGALLATYISIEAPLSGMSMNPARTLSSGLPAGIWNGLWIYFTAPPLGMALAAEVYVRLNGEQRVFCAKLHHHNDKRCIFRCNFAALLNRDGEARGLDQTNNFGKGDFNMKRRILSLGLIALMLGFQLSALAAGGRGDGKDLKFTVRIENISGKDGYTASNGTKFPFALSPGLWVVHDQEVRLYKEGVPAGTALERQAEDGDPMELVKELVAREHTGMQHGVFSTPVGATAPGPIGPGGSYEFTITAKPGMRLSMVMMFGQSNDWFYAPAAEGISLFENGKPIDGDVTSKFTLYDAGTEKDEEIGVGPNQGPRQKAVNTGEDEHGKVHKAKTSVFFSRTGELFRVTVTPVEMM